MRSSSLQQPALMLVVCCIALSRSTFTTAFSISPSCSRSGRTTVAQIFPRYHDGSAHPSRLRSTERGDSTAEDLSEYDDPNDNSVLSEPLVVVDNMEKAWRYVRKPLLHIGGKGATSSHGNSLRQLLEQHTMVKIKVNTKTFGSLQAAFEQLKRLAEERGAPTGMELLQARDYSKTILVGIQGTQQRILDGDYPPTVDLELEEEEEVQPDEDES